MPAAAAFWLLLGSYVTPRVAAVCLQVDSAYALGVCSSLVAACCGAGIVRVFACRTLAFQGTLPRLLPKAHESAARQAGGGWHCVHHLVA
jgi:hypothetical protein